MAPSVHGDATDAVVDDDTIHARVIDVAEAIGYRAGGGPAPAGRGRRC